MPNRMARPAPAKLGEGVACAWRAQQPHGSREGKQRDQHQTEREAEFLARHREDEVGVALGQNAS